MKYIFFSSFLQGSWCYYLLPLCFCYSIYTYLGFSLTKQNKVIRLYLEGKEIVFTSEKMNVLRIVLLETELAQQACILKTLLHESHLFLGVCFVSVVLCLMDGFQTNDWWWMISVDRPPGTGRDPLTTTDLTDKRMQSCLTVRIILMTCSILYLKTHNKDDK